MINIATKTAGGWEFYRSFQSFEQAERAYPDFNDWRPDPNNDSVFFSPDGKRRAEFVDIRRSR